MYHNILHRGGHKSESRASRGNDAKYLGSLCGFSCVGRRGGFAVSGLEIVFGGQHHHRENFLDDVIYSQHHELPYADRIASGFWESNDFEFLL